MTTTRRRFAGIAAAALAAPAVLRRAQAAEVELRMHHFLPPTTTAHAKVFKPWADKVTAESDGRITVRIFTSMQLGGAPPQLFDQVRDGVVDLVWTLPGYTPGRFPRLETFELPFTAAPLAIVNAQAVQAFVETPGAIGDELSSVHPICAWAHDQGLIHCRREVKDLASLQGLKLRFPNRLTGEALGALGASPIGMPVPQVPESIAAGVIDGAVVPWEVVPTLKLQELVRFHTGFPGYPTFYTSTMLMVMNKARYEGMPDDLRAVIDRNSGMPVARMCGEAFDAGSVVGRAAAEQRGNTTITLGEEETQRWRERTAPVIEGWTARMQQAGIDGVALRNTAAELLTKYGAA